MTTTVDSAGRIDNELIGALARSFLWQKMLEEGVCATIDERARCEGVNRACIGRVMRLTLLAPEILEAILDGRQPAEMGLEDLLNGFPLEWHGQRLLFA